MTKQTKPAEKELTDYRTWLYRKNPETGAIEAKIFDIGETCLRTSNEDWRLTPAEFTEDETLKEDPHFQLVAGDFARDLNTLLNIDHIDDMERFTEAARRLFGEDLSKVRGLKKMRGKILNLAIKAGMTEGMRCSDGDSAKYYQ